MKNLFLTEDIVASRIGIHAEVINLQESSLLIAKCMDESLSEGVIESFVKAIKEIIERTKQFLIRTYHRVMDAINESTGKESVLDDGVLFSEEKYRDSKILEAMFTSLLGKARLLISTMSTFYSILGYNDSSKVSSMMDKIRYDITELENSLHQLDKSGKSFSEKKYAFKTSIKTHELKREVNMRNANLASTYATLIKEYSILSKRTEGLKIHPDIQSQELGQVIGHANELIVSVSDNLLRTMNSISSCVMSSRPDSSL